MAEEVNAGLLGFEQAAVANRLADAVRVVDELYRYYAERRVIGGFGDNSSWYLTQTVWGLVMGEIRGKQLPPEYLVYARVAWKGARITKETVAVHYSGPFKQKLIGQMKERGWSE
jgi:hypothetical protein